MKCVFHCKMLARVGGWCLFALAVWLAPLSVAHSQTLQDSLQAAIDAMEYHPDSVDLRLKKAAINMQMEQWQLAKDEYDIVLQQQPGHLAALYFRAYANQQLRRYQFARLDYEQLLRIVPAHFEARLGLALLNQQMQRYTEAYDQLSLLISQHPDSAVVYAARADLEMQRSSMSLPNTT